MSIVKSFNMLLMEFIDEVILVFPNDYSLKTGRLAIKAIKKANPSLLVRYWYEYVCVPYSKEIESGNIDFFIEKDYSEDMKVFSDPGYFVKAIDKFRQPIREMDMENKERALRYVQQLCKMSFLYYENKNR